MAGKKNEEIPDTSAETTAVKQQELIFNTSVDITFLLAVEDGPRYRFITVNNAFLNASGLTRRQVEGKYAEEVIPAPLYPAMFAKYAQAQASRQTIQWEDTSDYPDGRKTGIITVTPVFNEQGVCTTLVGTLHDITERKKAEELVKSREQQLKLIYNTVSDSIFLISIEAGPRYLFTSVNSAFLVATGLRKEQVEGKYADEIIPEPSLGFVLKKYQQAILERRIMEWEETSEYPTGKKTGIVSITPVFDEEGICSMLVGTVHDITERKKTQQEKEHISYLLNERVKELTTLYRTDQALQSDTKSVDDILQELLLILPSGWQYQQITEARISLDDRQYATPGFHRAWYTQSATFITPDGKAGKIDIAYTEETAPEAEGPFLAEERHLINMLAEKLRNYFARRETTEKLMKEKELSERIVETLPGLFYIIDETGRYLRWNKLKESISGFTHAEMEKMNSLDFFEPEERDNIHHAIMEGFKKGHIELEAFIKTKENTKRLFYFTGVLIDYEGKPCLMGMGIDITERKSVEEKHRKSEDRFRVLVDSAPDATVIVDGQGLIQMVNRQTELILGYRREELIGKPVEILIPAELRQRHQGYRQKYHEEYRTREMGMGMELFAIKKDGTKLPVEISLAPFHSDEGVEVIASIRDITERKKAAELIQKEKELSESIINSLPGIFYLFDDTGHYLRWNKNHESVTGYTAADMATMHPLKFFEDEEGKKIAQEIKNVFTNGHATVEAEFRIKDGRTIPYYFNGVSIIYEGRPCVMGVGIDISNRKKMESEIRDAEIKFRTLVEKSLVGVYIVQKDRFTYVNPRFAEIFGYRQEELIGADPITTIISEDYQALSQENVRARLEGEIEVSHYEAVGKRKDGVLNWVEFFGSRTIYEGRPSIIGTMIDITERKLAEESLQKSEANLHTIFDHTDTIYVLLDTRLEVISFNYQAADFIKREFNARLELHTNLVSYFPQDRQQLLFEQLTNAAEGKQVNFESSYLQPNGTYNWYHVRMYPITNGEKKIFGLMVAISNITQKKLMEQEILNRNVQEQKKITRAVLKAQEKERNKIGQELHDNINQILAGAKMYLGLTLNKKEGSLELVEQSSTLIDNAINEIRSLTHEQVTPRLHIDLKTLIQLLVDNFNRQNNFTTTFQYNFDIVDINNDLKLNIYRIIQEGTNNIVKHAQASQVKIILEKVDPHIHIVLTDDGKGFDLAGQSSGIGMSNIRNRIESFNGKVSFTSSPGHGFTLDAYIPFSSS